MSIVETSLENGKNICSIIDVENNIVAASDHTCLNKKNNFDFPCNV